LVEQRNGLINKGTLAKYLNAAKSPTYCIVGLPGMVNALHNMVNESKVITSGAIRSIHAFPLVRESPLAGHLRTRSVGRHRNRVRFPSCPSYFGSGRGLGRSGFEPLKA